MANIIKNKKGDPIKIAESSYKPITREKLLKKTQALSDQLKKDNVNAKISVAVRYADNDAWKGGYFSDVGEPVRLHQVSDYDNEKIMNPNKLSGYTMYIINK